MERRDRPLFARYGPKAVAGLGGLYIPIAWGVWLQRTAGGASLSGATVEAFLITVPGSLILYGGLRLVEIDLHDDLYPRIVTWLFAGFGIMLCILGLLTISSGTGLDRPLFDLAFGTALGASAGLGIGMNEARALSRAREAEAHGDELQAERDLRERIVQTSPVGILTLDQDGAVAEVNEHATRITGYSRETLLSTDDLIDPMFDAVDGDGRPVEGSVHGEVLTTGEPVYDLERGILRQDGERAWILINGAPLVDQSGDVTGAVFAFKDITEHKERERELRQQRERLEALDNISGIARDITRELAKQSTRTEIETVVCRSLADSDSYECAWIGTVDGETREVVPTTVANMQGYLDGVTITADDSPTGRGPTGRALSTGELQVVSDIESTPEYDPWRETGRERGFRSSAAIPIAHEAQSFGVLNIYSSRRGAFDGEERAVISQLGEIISLAITAVDRKQQVEYERERLEFVNRLLRHNLLNGLNAIQAQTTLLDPHVGGEGVPHLETVRSRIQDMAELIETMRSLMRIMTDEEPERQPIDLERVLEDELQQARSVYRDAQFELRSDLDDVDTIPANDLIGEVFENLLVNAVRHNDADTPTVTVTAESDGETVTVDVADNGPGVSDELKDRVFEKGEKNFDSPGTGFGLYLSREIVESYDGTITVDDHDGGAVFSVTLPRDRGGSYPAHP